MSDSLDDRGAVAIAHDSVIALALTSFATLINRAWHASAVRHLWQRVLEAVRALTAAERLRCGGVALASAVITRLILQLL